ncbi:organoarsenical effux MFS transporter ArsJ [Bradyrhizobium sp. JYMT SZCCT0180]|uniref:organoarsenical effux MFS transporter ArsJ n=1 Tax=Bradyrhizobium sp. JYMT SZCCT0180 TaxID=2807666 RepID=UPI001BA644B7|nr:organoarsenical effux MFS transporter ArsJ [Bradyrhizobium sp. JYMT SZCCT0180]MBR1215230.1 organoarsenical effux MFS transporter ArsJ [Bradyrhizobium sp. JYMT SZCCT0180]
MVRNYVIVTASYWGFTLVDGALRMLVLFHFFRLGYSPFTLAFLFLLYEAAGIAANLAGGYFASRFGIPRMLAIGQLLQIAGLLMLSALDPGWGAAASVAWVVVAQGVAGVAKDLTKTASKSAIKATSAEGSGQLFRWVAWFTGSKNAMKGIGFFVGGLLLDSVGFVHALWLMAALLAVVFVAGLLLLPSQLGKAKSSKTIRELFGKSRGVNLLAAARIFMFGARDVWFVVGLPVFLYAYGWTFLQVGGFLAAWTIAYGGVQALAPSLVNRSADGLSREVPAARVWAAVLAAVPLALALIMNSTDIARPDLVLVVGLALFGLPFAVNSSLHSYLILAYAGSEKAAEDVGFYYAANAAGRLLGIMLSGALYQVAGITGCLIGSAVMLLLCCLITFLLPLNAPLSTAKPASV